MSRLGSVRNSVGAGIKCRVVVDEPEPSLTFRRDRGRSGVQRPRIFILTVGSTLTTVYRDHAAHMRSALRTSQIAKLGCTALADISNLGRPRAEECPWKISSTSSTSARLRRRIQSTTRLNF